MLAIVSILLLLAPLDLPEMWKNAIPFEAPFLLDDLVKLNKITGWKESSMPWTPQFKNAIVRTCGNLDPKVQDQAVTLVYKWAVVSAVLVEPGTKRQIQFEFSSSPSLRSEFEFDGERTEYSLSRRKETEKKGAGGDKFVAEANDREMHLEIYLQQVVQVYSRGKTPLLLSSAYTNSFATARLVRTIR